MSTLTKKILLSDKYRVQYVIGVENYYRMYIMGFRKDPLITIRYKRSMGQLAPGNNCIIQLPGAFPPHDVFEQQKIEMMIHLFRVQAQKMRETQFYFQVSMELLLEMYKLARVEGVVPLV